MKYLIGWRISEVQSHNTYETSPFRILKALFRRDGQLHLACAQLRARSDVARMHLLPRRFVISSQEQTGLLNKLRNLYVKVDGHTTCKATLTLAQKWIEYLTLGQNRLQHDRFSLTVKTYLVAFAKIQKPDQQHSEERLKLWAGT